MEAGFAEEGCEGIREAVDDILGKSLPLDQVRGARMEEIDS